MYEMNEDEMYDAYVEQQAIEADARKGEKIPKEKFYIAILRTGGKTFEEAEKEHWASKRLAEELQEKLMKEEV